MPAWRRLFLTALTTLGLLATATATAWASATPAFNAPSYTELSGVSCRSVADCVAVGIKPLANGGTGATYSEHWNGSTWTTLGGVQNGGLSAVSCVAAGCLAVGTTSSEDVSVAQWWNGSSWRNVSTDGVNGELYSVSCVSASYCVAVGAYDAGPASGTFSAIWNGTSWLQPKTTSQGEVSNLSDVSCVSATDCYAIGFWASIPDQGPYYALAKHWNGTSWSSVTVPASINKDLNSIDCTATSSCVIVGYNSKTGKSLIDTFDGSAWTQRSIGPADDALVSVSCVSASSCVAVGGDNDDNPNVPALAVTYNGSTWKQSHPVSPSSYENVLYSVDCTAAAACTATGSYSNPSPKGLDDHPLTELWNGTTWTRT